MGSYHKLRRILFGSCFVGFIGWQSIQYSKEIIEKWGEIKDAKLWAILLAIFLHLINHMLRSYRWQVLLQEQGYKLPFWHVFQAEMGGFFYNILIPRSGELARCDFLRRRHHLPIKKSLPTVATERSLDLIFFFCYWILLFIAFHFTGQGGVFKNFNPHIPIASMPHPVALLFLVASLLVLLFFFVYLGKEQMYRSYLVGKKHAILFFIELSQSLRRTSRWMILLTLTIAFSYFIVEYICFYTLEATQYIPMRAALFMFGVMTAANAIPLPGNSAYPLLVRQGLIATAVVSSEDYGLATAYAVITHLIQAFNAFVVGGGLMLWSEHQIARMRQKKRNQNASSK